MSSFSISPLRHVPLAHRRSSSVRLAGCLVGVLLSSSAFAQHRELTDIVNLEIGDNHACAVLIGGALRCWGANDFGQLGTGDTVSSTVAQAVPALASGVAAIAVGLGHTCSLGGGEVRCWGANHFGQLGDGTQQGRSAPGESVDLPGLAVGIAVGAEHSCALLADLSVSCWGRNDRGQLGDGSEVDRSEPVAVVGLSLITRLGLGAFHSCAVDSLGGVACWGANSNGELGIGTTVDPSTAQAVVDLPGAVTALNAGSSHSCATIPGHGVYCWGADGSGQLGNGDDSSFFSSTPVRVLPLPDGAQSVAAGFQHSCVQLSDGRARCWGSNDRGELGTGSATAFSHQPTLVGGADEVEEIFAGGAASCALLTDRRAKCWGANRSGVLGDGSRSVGLLPNRVATQEQLIELSLGDRHGCARSIEGKVLCWGGNDQGQVGDDSGRNQFVPSPVQGLAAGASAIAAGYAHACGIRDDGAAVCWGFNVFGALGVDTIASSAVPVVVQTLSQGVIAIASGTHFSCALTDGGAVKCWGMNFSGQLGSGGPNSSATPIGVPGLDSGVLAISAGAGHACALTDADTIICWGANFSGQLGRGTDTASGAPGLVIDLAADPIAVHASQSYTCAVLANGTAQCWGLNDYSQLGDGGTASSSVPVDVVGVPDGIASIALGYSHSCAVTQLGEAWCWGGNSPGIFGDGQTSNQPSPVRIHALGDDVVALAASQTFGCALLSDGAARCWGTNERGELGLGGRNYGVPAFVLEIDPDHLFTNGFER